MKRAKIYTPSGELYGDFDSVAEAEDVIEFSLSEGHYIQVVPLCRGCESEDAHERHDAYGYSTGDWCNDCYDSGKYPYRKDKYYDYLNAGEHLE